MAVPLIYTSLKSSNVLEAFCPFPAIQQSSMFMTLMANVSRSHMTVLLDYRFNKAIDRLHIKEQVIPMIHMLQTHV